MKDQFDALNAGVTYDELKGRLGRLSEPEKQAFRSALKEAISSQPVEAGRVLLAADTRFASPSFRLDQATSRMSDFAKYNASSRRRFGLATGPLDTDIAQTIDRERRELNLAIKGSIVAFSRGRGEKGLFSLIEEYLRAVDRQTGMPSDQTATDSDGLTEADRKRDLLLNALVRFAQKVLFVVNNEALFEPPQNTPGEDSEDRRYIRVLQTVGNSILVHVDAIRQQETHAGILRRAKDREISAIRHAFGGGPPEAYAQLLSALTSELTATDKRLAELPNLIQIKKDELAAKQTAIKPESDEIERLRNNKKQLEETVEAASSKLSKLEPLIRLLGFENDGAGANEELIKALAADPDNPDTKITSSELYDKVIGKFGDAAPPDDDPQKVQKEKDLANARQALEDRKDGITGLETTGETVPIVVEMLKGLLLDEHRALGNQKKEAETALPAAETELAAAEEKFAVSNKPVQELIEEIDELSKEKASKSKRQDKLLAAAPLFEDKRNEVVKAVEGRLGEASAGQAVKQELLNALMRERSAAGADTDKVAKAMEVVESIPAPLSVAANFTAGTENAKDVLDGLIASLRHQYTHAKNSGEAEAAGAAAALAEAYRQRADMIYLRPAMAYLRTSFTATTLQDNRVAWRNML
ncbi:MAG: hypothetical protein MI744_01155, partial [Pseudomonadales bacterium]|nr:hypothetical protein [Pseudomonadales bacterium]